MKKLLFLFILILNYSFACEDCYKWTTYKTLKFEIDHPAPWELNEEGDAGTTFILYADLDDKNDSFKENISLVVQDFTNQKLSLEQYTQSSESKSQG
jgi:hypothetical protein